MRKEMGVEMGVEVARIVRVFYMLVNKNRGLGFKG
jgi:hypothetical protein